MSPVNNEAADVFTIIPGLFHPESADYERLGDIPTTISKIRTFSLSGMDLTGDHQNALIYQGVADDENYVMQKYEDGYISYVDLRTGERRSGGFYK